MGKRSREPITKYFSSKLIRSRYHCRNLCRRTAHIVPEFHQLLTLDAIKVAASDRTEIKRGDEVFYWDAVRLAGIPSTPSKYLLSGPTTTYSGIGTDIDKPDLGPLTPYMAYYDPTFLILDTHRFAVG